MSKQGLSLVDIAELILKENKEPASVYDLYDKVCEEKQSTEEEKLENISQFYADITTSAKFVYVGDNTWDLKENQKIDLWEKDGSYYKEYNEIELPEEYKEKPKPVAKPKVAEVVVEPVQEVVVEPVVEEVVEEVATQPVVEEPVEEVVVEKQKPLDESVVPVVEEEFVSEEFDEELFEDFDEEKYNEYMDTYEDQYED